VVVYLDVDGSAATGVKSAADLTDNNGSVDDAIAGVLGFGADFGADFAWASVGMGSFDGGNLGGSTAAGWRNLSNVGDFAWLPAVVVGDAAKTGWEAAIALDTLYPNGIPATGITLRWLAVVVNKDGTAVSNQLLPVQVGAPDAKTATTFGQLKIFGP